MKGHIYIAGSFNNLNYSKCKKSKEWIDPDPYIWDKPFTWGICRPDIRKKMEKGDYIFFVLPKGTELPQMIFAYICVNKVISHIQAYNDSTLKKYRMNGKKNPDGNILVNRHGEHNIADKDEDGEFIHNFEKIKDHYVIADMGASKKFDKNFIIKKEPRFMDILKKVFKRNGKTPFDIISRCGQHLNQVQINQLLRWLND